MTGRPGTDGSDEPRVTVARRVVAEMIALAALEVPGVGRVSRGGPRWRAWLAGAPMEVRIREGRVEARVHLVARPNQSLPALTRDVQAAVGVAIERLLGMQVGRVTVVVDAVGA